MSTLSADDRLRFDALDLGIATLSLIELVRCALDETRIRTGWSISEGGNGSTFTARPTTA